MVTAESVHQQNQGSRLFTAGPITVVIRPPSSMEWDLYVDMRSKKSADARKLLRACILFPNRDEVAKIVAKQPFAAKKLDELIVNLIAPDTSELHDSYKYADAQMLRCDDVEYHIQHPTESVFEAFEEQARNGYSAAATHLVKACLLEPSAQEFDQHNGRKPGLKHLLTGHLMKMAGADLEFTEKK